MQCIGDSNKECLPNIIECESIIEWNSYLDMLYEKVFKPCFLESYPKFEGWNVRIRKEPMDGDWEHDFVHMTHENYYHNSKNPNDRIPDLRRSERLNWVKPIIEHFACSVEQDCGKILYWENYYKGYVRCNLFLPEERFHVVLERRKNVYFIITSFYVNKDWEYRKRMEKYELYKKQKTPLT